MRQLDNTFFCEARREKVRKNNNKNKTHTQKKTNYANNAR